MQAKIPKKYSCLDRNYLFAMQRVPAVCGFLTLNYEMLSRDFFQISSDENVIEFENVASYIFKLLRVFVEIWRKDLKIAFSWGIS